MQASGGKEAGGVFLYQGDIAMDYFNYSRRPASVVHVGGVPLGGDFPVRVQSMANVSTMDTEACVAQALRIVEAGGEYVRFTTQGVREAENLKSINAGLRAAGCMVPLVADVHFNPKVAEVAALHAEKVRINPGNYVDPARTFKQLEYTDEEYAGELEKLRGRFIPFLEICKASHTAIRIGVNHGSLSDRIMSRYGDTPEGMVESCMEFLRICVEQCFTDVVVSIKASNTVVMVKTVRLLDAAMRKEGMAFPLHLGVTEAGDGEDGRIKSAFGIGALLMDGLGDTIRVSLSEEPECEIPVARKLVDYASALQGHLYIPGKMAEGFDYFSPVRRATHAVRNIGGGQVPVVVSSRVEGFCDFDGAFRPDYMYVGKRLPAERDARIGYIVDADAWDGAEGTYPAFNAKQLMFVAACRSVLKFLFVSYMELTDEVCACLKAFPEIVVVAQSNHPYRTGEFRALAHQLMREGITSPLVFFQHYAEEALEDFQLKAAADMGALVIDGLCDGIFLHNQGHLPPSSIDAAAFGILQAGRVRVSKTEYISCPGCGRTLFDLQATIARVKAATSHLKGLKIGIMGCIVNGPGEMADADYGYVGAGRGRVTLYRRKECIEKNIPEDEAVERLLRLIRDDGACAAEGEAER